MSFQLDPVVPQLTQVLAHLLRPDSPWIVRHEALVCITYFATQSEDSTTFAALIPEDMYQVLMSYIRRSSDSDINIALLDMYRSAFDLQLPRFRDIWNTCSGASSNGHHVATGAGKSAVAGIVDSARALIFDLNSLEGPLPDSPSANAFRSELAQLARTIERCFMSAYLTEELCKLGVDDDAILEYCSGLLEDDTMDSEEKQEAIVGYLEAILEQDVTALVLQALALQSEAKTQRALETQKSAQMALSEALEKEKEELQRDAQSQVEKPKEMTLEERKQREKLIAAYEYHNAEIIERADGESEIVALALFEGIRKGDRRALARGITLVESTRSDHRSDARELVSACARMPRPRSLRIGLTGTPGVGKSTFIEAFGMLLINKGHRVSVL
ncbi:hypothetical protein GGF37_005325, partial [Kickxella alabastrina]